MNIYRPPMDGYKSPIKKISTAGSKIASAAVQRGSTFIDTVQNVRSPPKQHQHDTPMRRSGAGIRDRINQFDSASRYNAGNASLAPLGGAHSANGEVQQQNYRFNPSYRSSNVVCKNNNVNHHQQMDKENSGNFSSPSRRKINQQQPGTLSPAKGHAKLSQADKGNILENQVNRMEKKNTTKFALPSRHRKIKQKIQETFSPITERDNAEKTFQKVRDTFSPIIKRDNEEVFSPNKQCGSQNNASEQQKSVSPVITESDSPNPIIPDEASQLRKRLQQLEAENEKLESKNQSLENKCQVLIKENQRLEASQALADISIKKEQKSTSKKRLSNEHPLISTPLRIHLRAVQDASEINSFISVRKDPFPLFLPEHELTQNRQGDHLGDLGVLTGNIQNRDTMDDIDESSNAGEKRQNEEAIDLLNSAAFLFKTSRRRLN
ncbi:hypothetical protein ACHAXN_003125 [Cyclotella atomus]